MGVVLHQCHSWPAVSQHLAQWIADLECGVFDVPRLVTGSPGAARLISQELASTLPGGIAAGIQFMSLRQWLRLLTQEHDIHHQLQPWHPSRLPLQVWQEIHALARSGEHPALARHLEADGAARPHRPMALARRITRLLHTYIDEAPDMVAAWLAGDDTTPDGGPLPGHQTWQPQLVRALVNSLGSNPLAAHQQMVESLGARGTTPAGIVGLAHVPQSDRRLIQAAAATQDVPVWHLPGSRPDWTSLLDDATTTSCAAPDPPRRPTLEVHGSHDEARQVEVLRDALTHAFQARPELEPRDVVVVTPDVARWAPYLREAFAPSEDPLAHPGRQLRLEAPEQGQLTNEVLVCLGQLLRLGESRASGPDLLRLLLSSPIAHRWHFDHERLGRLLADAEVRWGLDEAHRAAGMLAGVTQNTWTRGIDRLLLSVPLGGQDAGLDVIGVQTTSTTDVATIGALSEVLSRIRRFVGLSATPATPQQWAGRLLELAGDLMRLPWEDTWMLTAASGLLTGLQASTTDITTTLTRAQFAGLFDDLVSELPRRARVGNGAIHVVTPGQLHPVAHKVVALLGVGDAMPRPQPDDVSGHTALRRSRFLEGLAAQASAAEHVIIVYPSRSVTNATLARPTTLDWLAQRLTGTGDLPVIQHSSSARDVLEFRTPGPSFDAAAARVVNRSGADAGQADVVGARRRHALALPDPADEPDPLRPHEIPAFLRNTAGAFLRHRLGLRLFEDPTLQAEMPVTVTGLDEWAATESLLAAAIRGDERADAMRGAALTESLPPGQLGHQLLRSLANDVDALWEPARTLWHEEMEQHPVDCEGVRGTVTTRGGRIVLVTASSTTRALVAPWVELLCLAAMGTVTTAHVHQLVQQGWNRKGPAATVLEAPQPGQARMLLGRLVRAVHAGRHRLVPMPLDPALKLVQELHSHKPFNPAPWALPPEDRNGPWYHRGDAWSLFYDGAANQLFSDPPDPRDDLPAAGSFGAFGGWARALLEPMLLARGGADE